MSLCPTKHAQTARFAVFPITNLQQMLKKAHIRYVTRAFYAFSFTFLQHICNVAGSFGDLTTNQLRGFHSVEFASGNTPFQLASKCNKCDKYGKY